MIQVKHCLHKKNLNYIVMKNKKIFHGIIISLMLDKINNIEENGTKIEKYGVE
jgi:hypothetical protein